MRHDDWVNKLLTTIVLPRKTQMIFTDTDDTSDVSDQQNSVSHIYNDIKGSYVQIYYPWMDNMSDNYRYNIPTSYYVIQKQYNTDLWKPLQGVKNGKVDGARFTTRRPLDSQQEYLSDRNINTVRYFPTYSPSVIIFEEKTHYNKLSQLQRISQRRTAMDIEQTVSKQMRYFLMEPLVGSTFSQITDKQSLIMKEYQGKGQIYEFKVDIDTSLNLLDNNMVLLTVQFKPMKYIEFIDLFFYVRSYQQGVGQEYTGEEVS